ncbi:universal stress protein [Halobacterium wangiae]|uniref:universal stress protein n=1 Tax=Halobacterium wangiae TaxID=2902623 RepID=UPI001E37A880|nr:universal stress protein [Halobacterium wangiae]
MVSRVLVPMDGSEMAEHALEYALDEFPDAELTVLTVVGQPTAFWAEATALALEDDIVQAAEERAEPVLARAREIAADYDTEIATEVRVGHPSRAIVNMASDFETVVVGSHGGSMADRLIVGNVAETVFRQSPSPVVVVR